ncbi:MAG: Plug domain-containing protein, partial [Leptospiraceae bacterium]|nr:Plug domain-containing protein [Leptospiraceae bacterium]
MNNKTIFSNKLTHLLLLITFLIPLYAQENQANNKSIYLSEFSPHKGKASKEISEKIYKRVKEKFEQNGFEVRKAEGTNLKEKLSQAKKAKAGFLLDGYYKIGEDRTLNIYSQIYSPEKENMIDALNVTNEITELEGIKLDPKEMQSSDEEVIAEFENKIDIRVRTNTKFRERRENINESAVATGIADEYNLPITKENISKASEEVFKFLSEKEKVTTASNVVTDAEKQPASITVINNEEIKHSGARTVNELLTIYVPGFFTVEDQDDTIAGFRGFAPDNNAKVLLLINGHNMNTEYFWGPPDSIINGMNLDYIDKIEVIRGPGSVTLGQGALL